MENYLLELTMKYLVRGDEYIKLSQQERYEKDNKAYDERVKEFEKINQLTKLDQI